MSKCERCRNRRVDLIERKRACNLSMPQFPIEDDGACVHFDSLYIEYPLTIEGIDNRCDAIEETSLSKCGTPVRVSPCGKEYKDKTYLGILLGDLFLSAFIAFNRNNKMLEISPHRNPAIFVPALRKILYGCESWWAPIENPEDLKDITSEEIENTWYVKLLNEMTKQP